MKKVLRLIKSKKLFLPIYYILNYVHRVIPDKIYLHIKYRYHMGKKLNLKQPESFNEKLQWLKLYDRNPQYPLLVDKYAVRNYVKERIGEEHLVPLIGVYEKYEDINFELLPEQFVMKPNHTSGDIYFCKDIRSIDHIRLKKYINKWIKKNQFWYGREWPYKYIKPLILCEKYLINTSGEELKDYKFLCFKGEVLCSFVCLNRFSPGGLNVDFYDIDWNLMPFERHYARSNTTIPKPYTYSKMIHYSEILSTGLPFARIDFYESDRRLFFSEITLYPGSGFEEFSPESYDYLLGNWLKIPIN